MKTTPLPNTQNSLLVKAAEIAAYSALSEESAAIKSHIMADSSDEDGSETSSDDEYVLGPGRTYVKDSVKAEYHRTQKKLMDFYAFLGNRHRSTNSKATTGTN